MRHHHTAIGKVAAIFARDEYQGKAGNLSHCHLIMALDKKSEYDDIPNLVSKRSEGDTRNITS